MTLKLRLILPIILILFLTACPQPTPPNTPPSASDSDLAIAAGRTSGSLDLADLVNDADGDELVYTVTQGENGDVSLTGSTVTYTVGAADTAEDNFRYTVSDGQTEASATISVSIAEENPGEDPEETPDANKAPVAANAQLELDEGQTSAELDLSDFISDPDADDVLSLALSSQASEGEAVLDGTKVTYTLENTDAETDSFEYTVTDQAGESATATVSVTIGEATTPANCPDLACDDEFPGFNGVVLSAITTSNDNISVEDLENENYSVQFDEEATSEDGSVVAEVVVEGEALKDRLKFNVFPSFDENTDFPATLSFDYTLTVGDESETATVSLIIEEAPPYFNERGATYSGVEAGAQPGDMVILQGTFSSVTLAEGQYMLGGGGTNRVEVDRKTELTYSKFFDQDGLSVETFNVASGNAIGGNMNVGEFVGNNLTDDVIIQQEVVQRPDEEVRFGAVEAIRIENSTARVVLNGVTFKDIGAFGTNRSVPISFTNVKEAVVGGVRIEGLVDGGTGVELNNVNKLNMYRSTITRAADATQTTTAVRIVNTTDDTVDAEISLNTTEFGSAANTIGYATEGNVRLLGINNTVTNAATVLQCGAGSVTGQLIINNETINCR